MNLSHWPLWLASLCLVAALTTAQAPLTADHPISDSCQPCPEGFMGHGHNCIQRDEMVNVRGKINGQLNGHKIVDNDMHAFIHTLASDGRNYIVARYPAEIGADSTLTLLFATPIHWLFAGSSITTLNGFELTGGVFIRESNSIFLNEQGEVIGNLYIVQNFTGINLKDNELVVNTNIDGKLPRLGRDEQVVYPDFEQDYMYQSKAEQASRGEKVDSQGSIEYKIVNRNSAYEFKNNRIEYNEKLYFEACESVDKPEVPISVSTQLMTKRIWASYTEGQVRFLSANYLRDLSKNESNPCQANKCSLYAECVVDSETDEGYYCQCKPGFDGDGEECYDINECDEGSTYCSPIAECRNMIGYYDCICEAPKVGDGRTCAWPDQNEQGAEVCERCDRNAHCVEQKYCQCNSGFQGDGFQCVLFEAEEEAQAGADESLRAEVTMTPSSQNDQSACHACHPDASCQRQSNTNGFCCTCLPNFIGNGKFCLAESMPVSIIGKIQGTLNSERLSDLDLYGYVITQISDSRNFVVIRKIPPHLAGSFQTLLSIASPISWLFSGLASQHHRPISNGFALTGGLFTRMVTLNFYDESLRRSHTLMIRQEYLGLDTNTNELSVRTVIDGNVPSIDPDAQVVFKDYSQKYERLSKGFIASKGEADYEITSAQNSQTFTSYRLQYSDEIQFNECPFLDTSAVSDVRLNSKRVFIQYTKGDGLVRFSSANFIYPADANDDPCETNACSVYAECIADYEARGNYSCMCKVGFEGDGFNCHDIDECQIGENDCDVNAECYNLVGHYECSCLSPYVGSGKECKYGEAECQGCDVNAVCVDKRCECRSGYSGDGLTCKPERECECGDNASCIPNYSTNRRECHCNAGFQGDGYVCQPLACNEYANCNANARCVYRSSGAYECECNPGFVGDGYKCSTQGCDILNDCGANGECQPDMFTQQYRCRCANGYAGNGYQCFKDVKSCDVLKNCHQNAECLYDDRSGSHTCKCKPGFSGDGYYCSPINICRSESAYETCDRNADCIYDPRLRDFICKCKSGFEGNGLRSKCYPDESIGLFLAYAQGSSVHKAPFTSTQQGATSQNRIVHIPGQMAVGISYDCHEKFIYWSDVSSNVINRIRYDGSNYSIVLRDVPSAEGLAVDWISRNIYFTDAERRTIEVASLDGRFRKVIVSTELRNPRGIAVDPRDGYLFWADWYRQGPRIERANMDGTMRRVIVSSDLGVPNGLYFDHKRQEVCWADAQTKRVECCAKDGSRRRVVTQLGQMYPFDLTEVRSNVYWTDWSMKEIQTVDKDGVAGESIPLSMGGNGRVYGIVAVKDQCPRGTNACDRTNGNCNQLCLPRPDYSHQCACSDGAGAECVRSVY